MTTPDGKTTRLHDARRHIDGLCKPPGSLGRLETLAGRLCEIQGSTKPQTFPRSCSVFAADHGVTAEGVSAWPSEVTASVVELMQDSRTASGVFANTLSCRYEVVNVGLLRKMEGSTVDSRIRAGTRNLLREAAMTPSEFDRALEVGRTRAALAIDAGAKVLVGGDMGIGNTAAATCLIALLCDVAPDTIVGRGAGVDDDGLRRKTDVIVQACRRAAAVANDAKSLACEVGGFEIVALVGFYVEAARRGVVVVLDGLISTAAAVLAERLFAGTRGVMVAGHRSVEPGHIAAIDFLGLFPLLDLEMRLGEATGALAALPLLDLAAAMCRDMAGLQDLTSAG